MSILFVLAALFFERASEFESALTIYLIIGIIILILIFYILSGLSKCVMEKTRGGEVIIKHVFFAFKNKPLRFFVLYIVIIIFMSLWSLLFIIQGIIKGYSYSQALYLMIENPE